MTIESEIVRKKDKRERKEKKGRRREEDVVVVHVKFPVAGAKPVASVVEFPVAGVGLVILERRKCDSMELVVG